MSVEIRVCMNDRREYSCKHKGSPAVLAKFREVLAERQVEGAEVVESRCLGLCGSGPNVFIRPGGIIKMGVKPEDVPAIVEDLIKDEILHARSG